MGNRNKSRGRAIHGILLLDKPVGITSNSALQQIKRKYNARKAGHTGSLDKMASGLLPICFGEATKFSGYLLDADKRYRAICKLGIKTNTGDSSGEIESVRPVTEINRDKLIKSIALFKGEITQIPPMFSALKHQGQRLYKLAYQGINIERKARNIKIHDINLVEYSGDQFEIEVFCSKGTYIRTLVEDLGEELGCGAHITALRRTASGPFSVDQMISFPEINQAAEKGYSELDSLLKDIDSILLHLAAVELEETTANYFCQGQAVMVPYAPAAGRLRIYTQDHHFLGVGEVLDDGRVTPRRLLVPPVHVDNPLISK